MSTAHSIGKHRVFEEDDLIRVVWDGDATLAELQAIMAVPARFYELHGHCLLLFDLRRAQTGRDNHRRWLTDWSRERPRLRLASFGASLLIRTLVLLVNRAAQMFNKQVQDAYFFSTEQEAREFLAAERTRLQRVTG